MFYNRILTYFIRAKQDSKKMAVIMPMLTIMQAAYLPLVNDRSKEEIKETLEDLLKRVTKNMV